MYRINENYLDLQGSYLFSTIGRKVRAYEESHPDETVIRLGIGDVTQPLTPAVIKALHKAVDEMADEATFRGYAPDLGYEFLRQAIADSDYKARGCEIAPDEIFISEGAKSDSGNIQEIFSNDCRIAVCDPVYPVYVDSNVMAGRTGPFVPEAGNYRDVLYLPCTEENGFVPEIPGELPELIYLCYPNNPTGEVISKERLQAWVDAANKAGSVIIYDAAYEAYISDPAIPHSIYECDGARTCAIELRSFSKNAGFTGLRLAFAVVPRDLTVTARGQKVSLRDLWARRHGTKYNGAPYIVQRAGEACYSEEGKQGIRELIAYYRENARLIKEGLTEMGYTAYGGVNSPYVWLKIPDGMTSWSFFDYLLEEARIVGTPGSGFGAMGEGFFRLTAFGTHENTKAAIERFRSL